MKKLITIQKREKLNDVFAIDEKGNGGANHTYAIHKCGEGKHTCCMVTTTTQLCAKYSDRYV